MSSITGNLTGETHPLLPLHSLARNTSTSTSVIFLAPNITSATVSTTSGTTTSISGTVIPLSTPSTTIFIISDNSGITTVTSVTTISTSTTSASFVDSLPNPTTSTAFSIDSFSSTVHTASGSSHSILTQTNDEGVPTMSSGNTPDQPRTSPVSKAKIAGIVSGVVGAFIVCLVMLLCVRHCLLHRSFMTRKRNSSKEVVAAPDRDLCINPGDETTARPLSWPPASGRSSLTDNETKHAVVVSNVESENTQAIVEPMTSMMQEMDDLRTRIADLEQRRQQEAEWIPYSPSVNLGDTNDNQSAPPAYVHNQAFPASRC